MALNGLGNKVNLKIDQLAADLMFTRETFQDVTGISVPSAEKKSADLIPFQRPTSSRYEDAATRESIQRSEDRPFLYRNREHRMTMSIPIVSFDTGAHNKLADEGVNSKSILAAMKSRFFFRLVGLSYEELVSTPDATRRLAFIEHCRVLQEGPWDCLNPHYEVLKLLIKTHADDPTQFRWLNVDVRSGELNHEIRTGEFTADDALSSQQRLERKKA